MKRLLTVFLLFSSIFTFSSELGNSFIVMDVCDGVGRWQGGPSDKSCFRNGKKALIENKNGFSLLESLCSSGYAPGEIYCYEKAARVLNLDKKMEELENCPVKSKFTVQTEKAESYLACYKMNLRDILGNI